MTKHFGNLQKQQQSRSWAKRFVAAVKRRIRGMGPLTRVVLVPTTVATILAVPKVFDLTDPVLIYGSFGAVTALTAVSYFLSYIESRLLEKSRKRAAAQRIQYEINASMTRIETERMADIIRHGKGNSADIVRHSMAALDINNTCKDIVAALHDSLHVFLRQHRGAPDTNIVTCLLTADDQGGFRIMHSRQSAGGEAGLVGRTGALKQKGQKSFACDLWNAGPDNMRSASSTQQASRDGRFMFWSSSDIMHVRGIAGYRIDIDLKPQYMFLVDVDAEGILPDSQYADDNEDTLHLSGIFEQYANYLVYEHWRSELGYHIRQCLK